MSGFLRRGRRTPAPKPRPTPAVGQVAADELTKARAAAQRWRNETAALIPKLNDTARERDQLRKERDAALKMLAGAKRECEETCVHARLAADRQVQLVKMQAAYDDVRAANAGYESARFLERVQLPGQRGGRRG